MNEAILLVEDEKNLRITLGDRLRKEGYIVDFATDGVEGLEKATRLPFDLIILDVMLPRRNGFDVCRDIRNAGLATPIVLLTARTETVEKVLGLKLGADDYVTKPFDSMELLARIEALLRRAPMRTGQSLYQIGPLCVDTRRTTVTKEGKPVDLSAREFQLLRYFIEHAGRSLSRDQILKDVWGYEPDTFTRTVDVHVSSLRQKLEGDPKKPELILTVPGLGYKLQEQ
ncbi:MAG: DNA-binding response regulator [Acidobacteria bacterium]|nr:MAG: DNA-binding response regulator [Acidobacteriota bacterium]